jgi:hypothetical protein
MKQIEKPDFDARMEREIKSLQQNIKTAAYMKTNHPDIFSEFKAIATAEIL